MKHGEDLSLNKQIRKLYFYVFFSMVPSRFLSLVEKIWLDNSKKFAANPEQLAET